MNKTLIFKKLANKWFIDIPYEGDIEDLQMVCGADTILEYAPKKYPDTVEVEVVDEKTDHILIKDIEDEFGCTYTFHSPFGEFDVWLCNVTKIVLGGFPPLINFKINS